MNSSLHPSTLERAPQVINIPAGYFGMVLGIIGMGFAWRYASTIWPVSPFIGEGLVAVATLIWLSLAFAFVYRLLRYPSLVVAEMRHPLTGSFVSLFPATTMLVSIGLAAYSQTRLLADILFLWEHACSCATPHGKVRDYGVASIRQRPPLRAIFTNGRE